MLLRPFVASDTDAFVAAVRESAHSVGRWMPWCHADYSVTEAQGWLGHCARGWALDGDLEFMGGAGLNQFNAEHNFCNLGYWVRSSAQRRGVATRAAWALAAHALGTLGQTRVELVIAVGNHASAGVARRLGAQCEGVARNRLVIGLSPVAAQVFALVPGDLPDEPPTDRPRRPPG
jgi:ribosomal-protein-serine acetyltransferase